MNKLFIYLLIAAATCFGAWMKFSHSHENMPIGCDEFGYLNQAKAIETGNTFSDHSERPYLRDLLKHLRDSGITDMEFTWMLAPHAYHLVPETNKIINQYPPGTAFVLSLIPMPIRKLAFPAIVVLVLVLFSFLGKWFISKQKSVLFDIVFPVFLFLVFVSAPFTTELSRVNSLALTFGPLVLAGMLLTRFPLWAAFLVAITTNFRLANIIMVLPICAFLPFTNIKQNPFSNQNLQALLKYTSVIGLAVTPLLLYNWELLGSPLSVTYSAIDTASAKAASWSNNILYYFDLNQKWFCMQIIVTCLSFVMLPLRLMNKSTFLKNLLFPLVNYTFFISHQVTMDYYPYASAMITAGMVLGECAKQELVIKFKPIYWVVAIFISSVITISGFRKYQKKEHKTFDQAQQRYASLCPYEIVWADLYSGTSEYVCGNNGFRFATGSKRSRRITMKYLHDKGFSQVMLVDDIPVAENALVKELNKAGIMYEVIPDPTLGKLISIKPVP